MEMFEKAMEMLGAFLLVVVPVALLATFIESRVSKRRKLNAFDQKRLNDNLELIRLLTEYVEKYPSQRFGQALRNIGILDTVLVKERGMEEWDSGNMYIDGMIMHAEPCDLLIRVKKELARQAENK